MRTFRTARSTRVARPVRLLAATGVALAALALTACDNGMGTQDEGSSGGSTSTWQTTSVATTAKASTNGATKASSAAASRVTCNGSNTTVTAKPVSRPLNHMLITVKNTGSKLCDLDDNPSVRFGEAQSAPRVMEESQPQAVVTLAPGESGYAGVLLSSADGSGEGGSTEKKVVIHFQGREPGSDGGRSASPALPAKGVYVDSTVAVTYWQSTAADALMY